MPVRIYQWALSPLMPPTCRFYPSCSNYTLGVLERYGVLRGGWMALRRILRCHPFHPGGYDPVPESPTVGSPTVCSPTADSLNIR